MTNENVNSKLFIPLSPKQKSESSNYIEKLAYHQWGQSPWLTQN